MKKILVCLLAAAFTSTGHAQFSRYVIQFKNKGGTPYSFSAPLQYLSQRAVDRRTRYNIAIDSSDLPVTPRYIDSLRSAGAVTVLNASRWLNSVSVKTTDATALAKIAGLPFVQSVSPIAARTASASGKIEQPQTQNLRINNAANAANGSADFFNYGQSYDQLHLHNGEFLHNIGLRGQNMIIGMLDDGFFHYNSLKAFDSVNPAGQVLGTYDFVASETSVTEDDSHGMECFSIIAANIPGQFVGTAPKASFYLFRSEDVASEYPVEEHNWVCAAERVDSAGGDVISSSLGYNTFDNSVFDHTYQDMNGNTTIAARGADLAAKKGLLVIVAAGNEGDKSWHYITTPADGDSVLAVGAVSTAGVVAGFSSYGPSSDGQVKPDVASVGVSTVLQTPGNTVGNGNGTSFACPNMAGLATCLWQGFPEFNNMRIINALRQAGSKATTPDDRIGYGIPDVKKATLSLLKDFSTASATATNCKTTINWTSKDLGTMRYEVERKAPGETAFTKIGERQGTGSLFGTHGYQFADSLINVQAGTISYRIREIIDTATATFTADYTDTVTVNLGASCIVTGITPVLAAGEEILLLPNPAKEKFTLKITTAYAIPALIVRVVDAKGQLVLAERKAKASGTASFVIPSYFLASGKYFVSVYNNGKLLATRELLKL
ncbi:S8 family serine peptidase [Flavisolibacter ginsenosidimutans]|uniref:S8 family serine peptidase n=1 Tax=Flavisolibacter ginsenosidimutans TaxID=661481 RepID=A0A5B8UHY1_9BACT|nr:S8 family serine peptidase [Flavisolibacter ginsenosidimutans]QEC55769.1 S8 family serine peptidase [Flavisolibacter ginsenosidimutans]